MSCTETNRHGATEHGEAVTGERRGLTILAAALPVYGAGFTGSLAPYYPTGAHGRSSAGPGSVK